MLADAERKVLRIIANYSSGRRRMPSLRELERKTGKSEKKLLETLAELAREGYISWSMADPERITLIQAWERGKGDKGSSWWQVYGSR
ncbi:helix-turn-helix domain-containing protein [Paenibacillus tyrfis]|uniref:helix-turn-helix domain-containing protein n=1 Tax=Paenibacillus tyrfis TaxID=1501230 RepID=UPI00209FDBDD|nr:helix-turn-helix domain-containing protein [Paenibacillus tyrfis]MCP1306953.1 hypothetical protein [Paenibacillus tyrfis]